MRQRRASPSAEAAAGSAGRGIPMGWKQLASGAPVSRIAGHRPRDPDMTSHPAPKRRASETTLAGDSFGRARAGPRPASAYQIGKSVITGGASLATATPAAASELVSAS